MSQYAKLSFLMILLLGIPNLAKAGGPGWQIAVITTCAAGITALNAVTAAYSYKAREVILREDPNSAQTPHVERSLMGSTAAYGISAASMAVAMVAGGPFGYIGAAVATGFSVAASGASVSGIVTSSSAFGIEDEHRYGPDSKKGTANSEFPVVLGTSVGSLVANVAMTGVYYGLTMARIIQRSSAGS